MLVAVLFVALLLCLAMLTPDRFGGYYDDSVYVAAAKSLTTDQGYRIISTPQEVAQTLVPPFYPFLLSLVWRVYPHFPENLTLMMLVSVISTISFLALSYTYLVKQGYATDWQALIVIALAGINWRTILLATSTLSELVFALLSVAALHLAEKYEKERNNWVTAMSLGVIMGLVFLTRTSGAVMLVAVAVYFVWRHQWRKALLPISVAGVFVIGWVAWCYVNRTTVEGAHAAYYAGYMHGIDSTISNLQALNNTSKLMVHLNIIGTNALGLIFVSFSLECLGMRYELPGIVLIPFVFFAFSLLAAGFLRELRKGIRLLHIYLVFYLVLHIIVPANSYDRYLIPIAPFLLFFLIGELSTLVSLARRGFESSGQVSQRVGAAFVTVILILLTGTAFYSNWTGIYWSLTSLKRTDRITEDVQSMEWIKSNTEPSDVVVCYRDQMYYLYTGRKTVRSIPASILDTAIYQARQPSPDEHAKIFLNIIDENNGRYLVLNSTDFRYQAGPYGESIKLLLEQYPGMFVPVFQSIEGRSTIYKIVNNAG
ncbi:MAG TPA: glycosyltransferase family 39 protein [Blastocatellia bacterium]|nr:glycosyltransferase family 39 protein [Blastocatellia bacterium]